MSDIFLWKKHKHNSYCNITGFLTIFTLILQVNIAFTELEQLTHYWTWKPAQPWPYPELLVEAVVLEADAGEADALEELLTLFCSGVTAGEDADNRTLLRVTGLSAEVTLTFSLCDFLGILQPMECGLG